MVVLPLIFGVSMPMIISCDKAEVPVADRYTPCQLHNGERFDCPERIIGFVILTIGTIVVYFGASTMGCRPFVAGRKWASP